MAHIEKRAERKYRARYRGPDGRERSKTFERRNEAEKFLATVEVAKGRGEWVDPRAGRALLRGWAQECLAGRIDLRASSRDRDEVYLRLHVLPSFGDVSLARITRADVQAWITTLTDKGLAAATVRAAHRLLSGVMNEAVEARLIPQSPCRSIRLPRVPRTEQRFLTAPEIERVAGAIDPSYRALVFTAAYLGCRWGELVGLKRDALHLLKREVIIRGSLEEVRGHLRYVEETKTAASRRMLTIPPFLAEILADHLRRAPDSDFVFIGPDGGNLRRANFRRRHWKPALRTAGIDEGLRFHDLRHTCASLLIEQGAHPKEIQARLGHSSITTTLDRYGHLMPSLGAQLDAALERARRDAVNDARPARGLEVAALPTMVSAATV